MVFSIGSGELNRNTKASWFDLGLFLIIAIFMLWGIGTYGLYEPHEAQYGGGGRAMVQRADWITSYINGERELNKPPLFYWLIATSFLLFSWLGTAPEFVARLPLAVISLSGAVVAWQWARELWGLRAGRMAALMLAVASGWYVFAHQLMIDELLGTLVLLSLYLLWKAIHSPDAAWRWMLFYATIGLAILAKGLLGIVFPVGVLGLYVLIRRDWKLIWRARPHWGILAVAAVIVPWGYLYETRNPGAIMYIVINEHFKRLFDQREPRDYGDVQVSAWMFLLYVSVWCSPWSFTLPQIGTFTYRNAFEPVESDANSAKKDAILLLALGASLPALFFLPIPSRLLYYSLPAVPSFVILAAGYWSGAEEPYGNWDGWKRNLAAGVIGVTGLVSFAATVFLPRLLKGNPDVDITPGLIKAIPYETISIGIVLLVCGYLIHARKERHALFVLIGLMAALEVFNVGEFRNFDPITSSKRMVETLAPAAGDDCLWISEGSDEVGAAAGTYFYLKQSGNANKYVLILSYRDLNHPERRQTSRPEPEYPGERLECFINQAGLDREWDSKGKAVLYVTDFKRMTSLESEPPNAMPKKNVIEIDLPPDIVGHRHVFANPEAWERLKKKFKAKT